MKIKDAKKELIKAKVFKLVAGIDVAAVISLNISSVLFAKTYFKSMYLIFSTSQICICQICACSFIGEYTGKASIQ